MYALRFKAGTAPTGYSPRDGMFISEIRSDGHTGLCDQDEVEEKGGTYSFVEDAAAALVRALIGGAGTVWDLRSVEIVEILSSGGSEPTPYVMDGVNPIPTGSKFALGLRGRSDSLATNQGVDGWLTIGGGGAPLTFNTIRRAAEALEKYTQKPGGNPFSIMVVPPAAPSVRVVSPSEVYA